MGRLRRKHLLQLLHGNNSISVGVKHRENAVDILLVQQSLMVNGSLDKLRIVDFPITVQVALIHERLPLTTLSVVLHHFKQVQALETVGKLLPRQGTVLVLIKHVKRILEDQQLILLHLEGAQN